MNKHSLSVNLRRLRKFRGYSQKELAERAGLSLSGYRKIEASAASRPKSRTLTDLAQALDVSLIRLLEPVPELRSLRFRSHKQLKTRMEVIARVATRLRDFQLLEQWLDDQIECSLLVEAAEADLADPIAAAHWARSRLGLRQDEPVRDLCGLLESRGIKVLLFDIQSDGFFGLSVSAADLGGPAVVVNTWQDLSVERQIFTAAHELGHLLLHRDDYDGGGEVRDEEEVSEREADLFAAHFLMPDEVFAKEWEATRGLDPVDRILKVKRMFRVSYKTVLRRLADRQPDPELRQQIWPYFFKRWRQRYQHSLGKRDEPFAVRLKEFKAGASETWRREEKETLSPVDFQEDRLPSLVRQAVETGEISISRGAEILGRDLEDMKSLAASWTL